MIKKFLCFSLVVLMTGCGAQTPSWNRSDVSPAAQSAPSRLANVPGTGTGAQASASTPVMPANPPQDGSVEVYPYAAPGQPVAEGVAAVQNGVLTQPQPRAGVPDSAAALEGSRLPPVKVALLLPLTGPQADLGQAMLQAAQLALFDMGYNAFELMPRDTKNSPQEAAQAAQSAIDDGAQLLLGPVFSDAVRAVKPLAERGGINMIAFSTDWSVAGGNTFIMGFLPFTQVERVVSYAAGRGYRKVGILAPDNDYGSAVTAAYNALAYRTGLPAADIARYAPEAGDPSEAVRKFIKYDEAAAGAPGTAQKPAVPAPFQAVLLPVGGEQARSVASLLSYYDLGPQSVKRLGTGLWDDNNLAAEPALEGAWFAAPSPDLRRDFEKNYRKLYGNRPPRLSSLAYDATALAAVLARKSAGQYGTPRFERADLLNPNGFAGIDGIFRFRADGLVERGLAILEFHDSSIRVVDPAPSTFEASSY